MLTAQRTRYKGIGDYSERAASGTSAPFPQAECEAADVQSFFRFFPNYLIKDALCGRTVLDFGSGYGGRTVEYKQLGAARVAGVEPFKNVVELSRRYAEYRRVADVEFTVCGHDTIPYADESFDVVISYDVLEHVADPRTSVAEICRVLRPGGLSINVFPVYFGAYSHHLDYLVNIPGLHWLFSAHTLVKAINSILERRGQHLQPQPVRGFDGAREVLPQLNGLSSWHLDDLFQSFETVSIERHPLNWWEPGRARLAKAIAKSSLPQIVRDAATSNMACILRKPGPSAATLTALDHTPLAPLTFLDWTADSPARITDHGIALRGTPSSGQVYLAQSPIYRLPRGARVGAVGRVRRGGLTLGLLGSGGGFATHAAVHPGTFRTFIDVPDDGDYRMVIANNSPGRHPRADAIVTSIGLVGLDPDACRLRRPITRIQPLEIDAWDRVHAPARRDGRRLRIKGQPAGRAAVAALSARYRLSRRTLVAAAGIVHSGGVVLVLLDEADQWVATVAIGEGLFRNGIEVPDDGVYRIVIASNLSDDHATQDVEVHEIGLVDRDPTGDRVGTPPVGNITAFQRHDWAALHTSTRLDGQRLHLSGTPAAYQVYAAESVLFQLPKGAIVGLAGSALDGRVMLGLLDSQASWAATATTRQGAFRTSVEVPADGEYRIVLAHDFSGGHDTLDVAADEVGLVGLLPDQYRVSSRN